MNDITVEELKMRLDEGEKPFIIDVREQYEYEEFNIGGLLVPLGDIQSRVDDWDDYIEKEVIVHCRSGARSAAAKEFLKLNGFKNVRNLIGGVMEWQEKFPV